MKRRGGRDVLNLFPSLGENRTKERPPRGDLGKIVYHVGDHAVSYPGGAVLVSFPGAGSSNVPPPHSSNGSHVQYK